MKKRIKKLIALGILSFTLANNNLIVFAEEAQEPIKPTEPIGENITNEQIIEYNQEVDNYNQQVDDYNTQIDTNYKQEKEEVDKQNADIEAYNQAEDTKAAAIKEENEQIQNQYNEDYAQYEKDLSTYKEREEKIINAGYESVKQYNDTMNAYYNDPCTAAEEENIKEENTFDIDKSYIIETSENSIDEPIVEDEEEIKYKVEIEHNFNERDNNSDEDIVIKSYKTEFEIGKNDIITFEPAGAQLEVYQNQYHYGFFANIDEEHIKGYWYLGNSTLYELCNYVETGWNVGDTHTVSYKDGQSKPGDPNLKMIYNYYWKILKKVNTYIEPEEPKLELKEEYIPEYKEKIAEPEKKEHLTYLNHLEIKEEPKTEEKPETTPEPEKVIIENIVTPTSVPTSVIIPVQKEQITGNKLEEIAGIKNAIEDNAIITETGNIRVVAPQTSDDITGAERTSAILLVIGLSIILFGIFKYKNFLTF